MAVPKRKTSPSRRGMRNSHRSLKVSFVRDRLTGEARLSHCVSKDGIYRGRVILKPKNDKKSD